MRILLFATGALNTCFLPVWINWMTANRAGDSIDIVLSEHATEFVAVRSVAALTGEPAAIDRWDDPVLLGRSPSPHTWLAGHDAILICPATLNTLSRIAAIDASTPMLNAVQCTAAPVFLAPNLPPGADRNPAVHALLDELRTRATVVEPVSRPSVSVPDNALVTPPIWDVFAVVDAESAARAA
ncbi:flavoprotein [Nocardia terpenica]|uniref:Phosphopantothenoylcysteine decarboxylase n=1 Tax=Nocardia terpenica TaxID=455432 RepID=A0A291REE9_9NOCA|nr:flavoprotein [Nocardia terpenica]ATL65705.1 phosphopantothenoylcysteine decarboxylase [Nocardia terpenica]